MRIRVRSLVSLAILLGVLLPLALINARPAHAFVYVVNTPTDGISATHCSAADGQCSLRNAIDSANINPGADTIVFDQSVFTPGTTINVVTPLPYPDDPDGITIDGGANGVTIKNLANSGINFGLAFIGDTTVQNVTVKNITVQGFNYDGLQVCPQPNYSTGTCHGTTFNVNFDNVTTEFNAHDGIEVLGYEINSTNLDHVISAFNQHIGIDIDGGVSGGIDNPSITNSNSGFNTDGNIHLRGSGLYGLQMMDTVTQSSNHDGIFIDVTMSRVPRSPASIPKTIQTPASSSNRTTTSQTSPCPTPKVDSSTAGPASPSIVMTTPRLSAACLYMATPSRTATPAPG